MPEIWDYSAYGEFKTPGLFKITNKTTGSVLDLAGGQAPAGTAIIGYHSHGGDNQQWQIVDVGDSKYVIICRLTGSYLTAKADSKPTLSSVGYPDNAYAHWKIQKPDAKNPQLTQFQSVAVSGNVLELLHGSDKDSTEVCSYSQSDSRQGQKWLLKRLNSTD